MSQSYLVYTTSRGVNISVEQGRKSDFDFVIRYQEPGKRNRTPQHIHLIIDLYMKITGNQELAKKLVKYIIDEIILKVQPSITKPPTLQIFSSKWGLSSESVQEFQALESYGEYSLEFLLVVIELLMIQEKTNYPQGTLNLKLFQLLHRGADIFSIVSAATFRGR